ncbi:YceI family protein [Chryseosolibacter indicus]|uniref:YceI family protein n=1 Tax=Chryseosolibacter indicus TaxID=2782351 RepID=A0ABS5VVT0_9BACT|nr:YceI family protein [Chryseosolibacter indicus]MBT1704101.1 YceI family protein [Chryseosolibacter indicus]
MATMWIVDRDHSEVKFKVKYLGISSLTGCFNDFSGVVLAGENFSSAHTWFEVNVCSIFTNNERRDAHLKSPDFFDVARHPVISFCSDVLKIQHDNRFELNGDLLIKDNVMPITLSVTYAGTTTDPWGNTKAGFEVRGLLNKKQCGLKWNATTGAGARVVSEDVILSINMQLLKQSEQNAAKVSRIDNRLS